MRLIQIALIFISKKAFGGSLGFKLKREYSIYKTLRLLAKQRVALVLPGNVWVIEKAIPQTETNLENLQTCMMRGWVEILHDSVNAGRLTPDGHLPNGNPFQSKQPIYKLTDSGWNAIHRTHITGLLGVIIALIGVAITLIYSASK
jgi:hypothetical protein